ncbi:MAG: NAD(+) diphosphatase [Pseudomonadota bacterium]
MTTAPDITTIDRAAQRRADADFISAAQQSPEAHYFIMVDEAPAIVSDDARTTAALRWFRYDDIKTFDLIREHPIFMGLLPDGAPVFALNITEHRARILPGGPFALKPWVDLRSLAVQGVMPEAELAFIGQAKSVSAWQMTARCCGVCGGNTNIRDGGWRRKCWSCGQQYFPRMDPAVIMLVVDGDRCILAHETRFPDNMYSTLAGYIEPGETFEDAVRREVHEEVGIEVGEVSYLASQAWPFPHSLMIGCIGTAASFDITPDPQEIADARWFDREEMRAILEERHDDGIFAPMPYSIARKLMQQFVDNA